MATQVLDSRGSAFVLDLLGVTRAYEQELEEHRRNKQSKDAVELLLGVMEGKTDIDMDSALSQLPSGCAERAQSLQMNCQTIEESLAKANEKIREHEGTIKQLRAVLSAVENLQKEEEKGMVLLGSLSTTQNDTINHLYSKLDSLEKTVPKLKDALQCRIEKIVHKHNKENQRWSEILSTKEQEFLSVQGQVEALKMVVQEREKEIQAIQEREREIEIRQAALDEKNSLLVDLRQQLSVQTERYAILEGKYLDMEDALNKGTEELQKCELHLKQASTELEKLQNDRNTLSQKVQEEKDLKSELSTQIESLRTHANTLEGQLQVLSEEKTRLIGELEVERRKVEEQSHSIKKIQSLKNIAEANLNETSKALEEAEECVCSLTAKLNSVTKENLDLSTHLLELQSNLNTKSTVCKNIESSLELALQAQEGLKQTIEQYEQDLKESQEETFAAREQLLAQSLDNAQLQERIMAMGEETTRLREALLEQISDLQTKIVENKSSADSISAQLTAALEDLCHRDHQIEEDRKTILALQADLEKKECQVNEYQVQLESMSQDMQRTLSAAEMDFRTQLMAADHKLEERLAEEASLKDRLLAAEEAQRAFKAKSQELVTKAQEEVEMLMEKLEEEKKLTTKQKELLAERNDASAELQQKVDSAMQQIDKLETSLEEAHRERDAMREEVELIRTQGTEAHRNRLHDQLQLIQEQGRQIEEFRGEYGVIDEGILLSADEVHRVAVTLYQLAKDRRRVDGASTNSSLYMSATSIRETETNLVHQHLRTLESECKLLRDASERMATYLKTKGTEIGTLQERVGVKEKEVNLLLDLTKSREDRINALLDELTHKNELIGEQSDTITRLTGEVKRLQTLV